MKPQGMKKPKGSQRGTSLLEMLFTMAIAIIAMTALYTFFERSRIGLTDAENAADLSGIVRSISNNLRHSLDGSERLMVDFSDEGTPSSVTAAYQTGMLNSITGSASGAPRPVAWSVTPKAQSDALFKVVDSAMHDKFGNLIYFIASCPPIAIQKVSTSAGTLTPGAGMAQLTDISIDRYQFVLIYLALDSNRRVMGMPGALRLVEWRSIPFVSYGQISSTAASTRLTETVRALNARGYNYAYDIGADDFNAAFFKLDPAGTPCVATSPTVFASLPEGSWSYMEEFNNAQVTDPNPLRPLGRVNRISISGGISGVPSSYSIAYNSMSPTVNSAFKVLKLLGGSTGSIQVPLFADASTTTGFPGGFEVGIIGRPNSRQIFIRNVVMASSFARQAGGEKNFPAVDGITFVTIRNPR